MSITSRISIFSTTDEKLNILIPFFMLPFVVYFTFSQTPYFEMDVVTLGYIVSGVFLLNWTHTAFTIGFFFELPGFKSFLKTKKITRFIIGYLVIFCFCFFCYILDKKSIFSFELFNIKNLVFILLIAGAYHSGKQFQGLSLLYNRNLEHIYPLSDSETSRLRSAEVRERILFSCWILELVVSHFIRTYFYRDFVMYRSFFYSFSGIVTVFIFLNAFFVPHFEKTNKPLYLGRILIASVGQLSTFSALSLMAIHGLEYFFVSKTFYGNARVNKTVFGIGKVAIVLGVAQCFLWLFSKHPKGNYLYQKFFVPSAALPLVLVLIGSLAATTHLYHIYLDGMIFRFRDPDVQKHIAPQFRILKK